MPTQTATATATGPIVLLTRLARVVYRRSTVELVGMRLRELGALAYLRDQLAEESCIAGAAGGRCC